MPESICASDEFISDGWEIILEGGNESEVGQRHEDVERN